MKNTFKAIVRIPIFYMKTETDNDKVRYALNLSGEFDRPNVAYYNKKAFITSLDGAINTSGAIISFDKEIVTALRELYKQTLHGKRIRSLESAAEFYKSRLKQINEKYKKKKWKPLKSLDDGNLYAGEISFIATVSPSEFIVKTKDGEIKVDDNGKPIKSTTYSIRPLDIGKIHAVGGFALNDEGMVDIIPELDGDYALFTGVGENIILNQEKVRISPELAEKFRNKSSDEIYLYPGSVWVVLERVTIRAREKVNGKITDVKKEILEAKRISMVSKMRVSPKKKSAPKTEGETETQAKVG